MGGSRAEAQLSEAREQLAQAEAEAEAEARARAEEVEAARERLEAWRGTSRRPTGALSARRRNLGSAR